MAEPSWYSEDLLRQLADILNLEGWRIGVEFVDDEELDELIEEGSFKPAPSTKKHLGYCDITRDAKTAMVYVLDIADKSDLIHEMTHIVTDDLWAIADAFAESLNAQARKAFNNLFRLQMERLVRSIEETVIALLEKVA